MVACMVQYLFIPAGGVRWGEGRREKISTGLGWILLTLPAAMEYIPTGEGQIRLTVWTRIRNSVFIHINQQIFKGVIL